MFIGQQDKGFARRVQQALSASNLGQNELARQLGVSQSTVSDWMRKGARPHSDVLSRLPAILGVSADWLLSGRGPKTAPALALTPDARYLAGARAAIDELKMEIDRLFAEIAHRWEQESRPEEITRPAREALATARLADRALALRVRARQKRK